MLHLLARIGTPFVGWILGSPLHPILSRSLMLVSVRGRKTGHRYTTPVSYHRDGDGVTFVSRRGRLWLRNLGGGVPVTMRIRGEELAGIAAPLETDPAAIGEALRRLYPRLSDERIARMAAERVAVRVRLTGSISGRGS